MKILFPNTSSLAHMEGIEFRQGEVKKHESPVIVPEYPWEEIHTYLYGSVMKKGPLYRMWYQSYVDGYGFFVNYARSKDGIEWHKPLMKKFRFEKPDVYPTVAVNGEIKDFYLKRTKPESCKTNIVSTYHIPSVIYDSGDKDFPYKLFGYTDGGYCVAFSRDGINFKEYDKNPVLPVLKFPNSHTKKTWFSDVSPAFKDTVKNKFVAFVKTYMIDENKRTRRCVGFSESEDFVHWSKPETLWVPGESEDRLAAARGFKWADFYGLCGFNYGKSYLGFLWLFYIDYEVEKGTHDGKVEVYLVRSDDGKQWKRISDEPFIPLSRNGWDTDMIYTASAPVFLKDGTIIYYGGSNFSHGVGHEGVPYDLERHGFCIGVANLRKDGFVCAYSSSGGCFVTKPYRMNKGLITLNADTEDSSISIEIMKGRESLKTFEIADVDSVSYRIKSDFKGDIALKVRLNGAKLYSLEVL